MPTVLRKQKRQIEDERSKRLRPRIVIAVEISYVGDRSNDFYLTLSPTGTINSA